MRCKCKKKTALLGFKNLTGLGAGLFNIPPDGIHQVAERL